MLRCTRLTRVRGRSAAVALAAAAFSFASRLARAAAALSFAGTMACTSASSSARPIPRAVTQLTAVEPARFALSIGRPCVKSGLETCFNATDDDCNGLIDEGCGLDTGPIQIVAAWAEEDADVDLLVLDPKNEPAQVGIPTASGLVKDWDCPSNLDACRGQNLEIVRSLSETVPLGTYEVTLLLKRGTPDGKTIGVSLGGHIGDDPLQARVELSATNQRISWKLRRFVPERAGSSQ